MLEAAGNAWDIYDIVVSLVTKIMVANARLVRQIAEARVKTDKADIQRLITLLIADIVPEVWVPPHHVRELRALISFRRRLASAAEVLALKRELRPPWLGPQFRLENDLLDTPLHSGRSGFNGPSEPRLFSASQGPSGALFQPAEDDSSHSGKHFLFPP